MKQLRKKMIFTSVLALMGILAYPQIAAKIAPPKVAGVFKLTGESVPDSLQIVSYPHVILKSKVSHIAVIDAKGNFNFNMPRFSKRRYVKMVAYREGKQLLVGTYFVDPGDDIVMQVTENPKVVKESGPPFSILFTGKGAEKFNLIESLQEQYKDYREKLNTIGLVKVTDSSSLVKRLAEVTELCFRFSHMKEILIGKHVEIEPETRSLLTAEYARYHVSWLGMMEGYFRQNKQRPEIAKLVREHFIKHRDSLLIAPSEVTVLAPVYIQTLVLGLKAVSAMNDSRGEAHLRQYYELVKSSGTGLIRERMLVEFFTTAQAMIDVVDYDQKVYDSLVLDASGYISNTLYTKLLLDKFKLKVGTDLFDATFLNLNGKPFDTGSLRGKVVLIDIWGEGCTACAIFHQRFEREVYPIFKDRDDFVVLSISVDTKREKWLSGIKTGLMSSAHYLNVSTGSLGVGHPFLKYYNIKAIPFILLVDREHKNLANLSSGSVDSGDIIEMINGALGVGK